MATLAHTVLQATSILNNVSQGGAHLPSKRGCSHMSLSLTMQYSPWACLATYARGAPSSDRGVWLAGSHCPSWGRWAWK